MVPLSENIIIRAVPRTGASTTRAIGICGLASKDFKKTTGARTIKRPNIGTDSRINRFSGTKGPPRSCRIIATKTPMNNSQNRAVEEKKVKFIVTDFKNEINVIYSGVIPNLFAEGKGVVAEGYLNDRNFFSATKILAKHDENYMPPEVKAALEEK